MGLAEFSGESLCCLARETKRLCCLRRSCIVSRARHSIRRVRMWVIGRNESGVLTGALDRRLKVVENGGRLPRGTGRQDADRAVRTHLWVFLSGCWSVLTSTRVETPDPRLYIPAVVVHHGPGNPFACPLRRSSRPSLGLVAHTRSVTAITFRIRAASDRVGRATRGTGFRDVPNPQAEGCSTSSDGGAHLVGEHKA